MIHDGEQVFCCRHFAKKKISGKKNGDEKKRNLCIVRIKKRLRNFKMTFLSYFLSCFDREALVTIVIGNKRIRM
jgi:hypothetical protein